jgi:DNA-directed RNA polymerase subunit RPC12/RpoP
MKTWTMVLRCHRCAGKFTLREMPLERLSSLPLVAACPHCGAGRRSRRRTSGANSTEYSI